MHRPALCGGTCLYSQQLGGGSRRIRKEFKVILWFLPAFIWSVTSWELKSDHSACHWRKDKKKVQKREDKFTGRAVSLKQRSTQLILYSKAPSPLFPPSYCGGQCMLVIPELWKQKQEDWQFEEDHQTGGVWGVWGVCVGTSLQLWRSCHLC